MIDLLYRAAIGLCIFNAIWFSRLAFAFLELREMKSFSISLGLFTATVVVILSNIGKVV